MLQLKHKATEVLTKYMGGSDNTRGIHHRFLWLGTSVFSVVGIFLTQYQGRWLPSYGHTSSRSGYVASAALGIVAIVLTAYDIVKERETLKEFHARKRVYEDVDDLLDELQSIGMSDPKLIIGVDFSSHNVTAGKNCFMGKSLHSLARTETPNPNPYQLVIWTICKVWPMSEVLSRHAEDKRVRVYGFHDCVLLPFLPNEHPCIGFEEVLAGYSRMSEKTALRGTASLGPLIERAIEAVGESMRFHLLVIVGTAKIGNRTMVKEAWNALKKASNYPLVVIMIGVGDGPFDLAREFATDLRGRKFINFHFVQFDDRILDTKFPDIEFAKAVLSTLPERYREIQRLGLLEKVKIESQCITSHVQELLAFDPEELLNEDDMILDS